MDLLKEKQASFLLRLAGIVLLGIFFFASVAMGVLQGTFKNSAIDEMVAVDGQMYLPNDKRNDHVPFYLSGEWEYYENVFCVQDQYDYSLLEGQVGGLVNLPIQSVAQSVGPASYRLVVDAENSMKGYSFYLPNYKEDFAIYVNGNRIMPLSKNNKEKFLYTMSGYLYFIDFDTTPGKTEIILSANSSERQSLLYKKPIVFGETIDVSDYVAYVWRDETFLIGVILILVIIGIIFMLMRTKTGVLLNIALFDTFLSIRILLGFHVVNYFLHNISPNILLGNIEFVGLQYGAIFLSGAMGCVLSRCIFDPMRLLPNKPVQIQQRLCAAGSIFTVLFYRSVPNICVLLLFLSLLYSVVIITWHIYHVIRDGNLNGYYIFQAVKTYYVGVVLGVDVLFLGGGSYNALVYAYVVFFLAHLFSRLMDSNLSYQKVELLNKNLEQIIEERTKALTDANEHLSELSIRDPLTKAYNRLYFEETMEKTLAIAACEDIYLCIFDLDFFKKINDSFGHGVGDDQLKDVVNTVHLIVDQQGILTRVGGEEFAILFQDRSLEQILSMLEQIRGTLAREAKENKMRTTASFGLAKYKVGLSAKEFFCEADKCLYKAKEKGRNCIVV